MKTATDQRRNIVTIILVHAVDLAPVVRAMTCTYHVPMAQRFPVGQSIALTKMGRHMRHVLILEEAASEILRWNSLSFDLLRLSQ